MDNENIKKEIKELEDKIVEEIDLKKLQECIVKLKKLKSNFEEEESIC